MYVPARFEVSDKDTIHSFVEQNSFGVLVSKKADAFEGTHLPFLLDRNFGENGQLVSHMARANPQWQALDGQPCLVIFSGPHAYVSAGWYEETNVVPSWNYVAVHVHGRFVLDDSKDRRLEIVRQTTDFYEAGRPRPWSVEHPDADFVEKIAEALVGFRVEIDRYEGNWKLSQHHPTERLEKTIDALRAKGGDREKAIADLMEAHANVE